MLYTPETDRRRGAAGNRVGKEAMSFNPSSRVWTWCGWEVSVGQLLGCGQGAVGWTTDLEEFECPLIELNGWTALMHAQSKLNRQLIRPGPLWTRHQCIKSCRVGIGFQYMVPSLQRYSIQEKEWRRTGRC